MSKGIFCGSGLADMGGGTFILYFEFEIVFTDGELITLLSFSTHWFSDKQSENEDKIRAAKEISFVSIENAKENLKNEGINIEKFTNYSNNKQYETITTLILERNKLLYFDTKPPYYKRVIVVG